jgi:hypothetical protein
MRDEIKEAMDRYANTGCPLGGFLTAVMENNLMEAFGRADEDNTRDMREIVAYVYNEMPGTCHGSPEIVAEWIKRHKEARELTQAETVVKKMFES